MTDEYCSRKQKWNLVYRNRINFADLQLCGVKVRMRFMGELEIFIIAYRAHLKRK